MRKLIRITALLCAVLSLFLLSACGKQKDYTPADTEPQLEGTPIDPAIENPAGYPGDHLAKVLTVEGSIVSFEYYEGAEILDYSNIAPETFSPTGDKDGFSMDECNLYSSVGGSWAEGQPEDITVGCFIVITNDAETGELNWVTVIAK